MTTVVSGVASLVLVAVALISFTACSKNKPTPGDQCLASFRMSLKDPDSGRVVSFDPPVLIYTATNSYGARIKGKALCSNMTGEWRRDHHTELMQTMDRVLEKYEKAKACRAAKGENCYAHSEVLARQHRTGRTEGWNEAMLEEAREELGF